MIPDAIIMSDRLTKDDIFDVLHNIDHIHKGGIRLLLKRFTVSEVIHSRAIDVITIDELNYLFTVRQPKQEHLSAIEHATRSLYNHKIFPFYSIPAFNPDLPTLTTNDERTLVTKLMDRTEDASAKKSVLNMLA